MIFIKGAGDRSEAPVAEGGPVGYSDVGNRQDWFSGVRRPGAVSSANRITQAELRTRTSEKVDMRTGESLK